MLDLSDGREKWWNDINPAHTEGSVKVTCILKRSRREEQRLCQGEECSPMPTDALKHQPNVMNFVTLTTV